ncbi:ABC transporter ATP-binding protein [Ammoniphilus resinae]|uniref:Iron complex transport system ATP-binding protein n=1 Tax=Ammoniphilus resinae TaxID=861532 RepID=A0ABS4GM94_9BACL|nr:ABC transporter ATP-binding protein [Ammoniphilus resinae]MBP1931227.1 iron complex transport system ATP-binding protein [Ammoniphilus resinae]
MGNIIHVENVFFKRDERMILSDIHWDVNTGEHWAMIGLNGAGKTTLLKMINGYMWPVAGTGATIEVLGKRFGSVDLRELRKSIGWVSTSLTDSISPSHTVIDVVMSGKFATFGLYDSVANQDKEKAMVILTKLGAKHTAERRFGVCSQGEKQKIMISRALMANPKLLILDEPCTGLDIYSRENLLLAIDALGKQPNGPTMIYVTHHIEEVCPIFTHALIMKEGQVVAAGTKDKVITDTILSDGLGLPLEVEWNLGRAWVKLREELEVRS